jgi:hypothetical protein
MVLVPCARCRQPFYASRHDAPCIGAVCPYCEYAEILPEETYGDAAAPTHYHLDGQPAQNAKTDDGCIARRCTPLTRLDTRGASLFRQGGAQEGAPRCADVLP